MKKILAFLLTGVLMISTVFGVTASAESSLSGTVTMWSFPLSSDDVALFEPIIKAFNEQYPDVTIDIQHLPWNGRYEKMLTAIAGGEAPNVCLLYTSTISEPVKPAAKPRHTLGMPSSRSTRDTLMPLPPTNRRVRCARLTSPGIIRSSQSA